MAANTILALFLNISRLRCTNVAKHTRARLDLLYFLSQLLHTPSQVHSRFRGEVAVRRRTTVRDAGKDRYRVSSTLEWTPAPWMDAGDRRYSPADARMQIYAGFAFRRHYLRAVKGTFAAHAEDLAINTVAPRVRPDHDASQLEGDARESKQHNVANRINYDSDASRQERDSSEASPQAILAGGATEEAQLAAALQRADTPRSNSESSLSSKLPEHTRLGVFEMMPDFAWRIAHARIEAGEAAVARDLLLQRCSGEDVRDLLVDTTVLSKDRRAVYLPAYVFEVHHNGQTFRIFVSGVTGDVGGEQFLSGTSVGMLAGGIMGLATALVFPEPMVSGKGLVER